MGLFMEQKQDQSRHIRMPYIDDEEEELFDPLNLLGESPAPKASASKASEPKAPASKAPASKVSADRESAVRTERPVGTVPAARKKNAEYANAPTKEVTYETSELPLLEPDEAAVSEETTILERPSGDGVQRKPQTVRRTESAGSRSAAGESAQRKAAAGSRSAAGENAQRKAAAGSRSAAGESVQRKAAAGSRSAAGENAQRRQSIHTRDAVEYDDEREQTSDRKKKKSEAPFGERVGAFFAEKFASFTKMDWLVCGTGVVIFLAVIVLGCVFFVRTTNKGESTTTMEDVGHALADMGIVGESGLVAVSEAWYAKQVPVDADPGADMPDAPDVTETPDVTISVRVSFTSVEKDLKVKFTNSATGKLINNAAFRVTLTPPSGSDIVYEDDDMDGIIYHNAMTPGTYGIKVEAPERYEIVECASSVQVRDTIVYEKIEVADEIKTEAEVNVALEDTQMNAVIEQETITGTLTDTVEWVESTKTTINNESGYSEIPKSAITDPALVAGRTFYALAATETPSPTPTEGAETGTPTTGTPTTEPTGTTTPDPTVTPSPSPSTDPTETPTPSPTPSPTPTQAPVAAKTITLDKTALSLQLGVDSPTLTATLEMTDGTKYTDKSHLTWESSDKTIVTVDENGKLTPVGAGTAKITVTSKDQDADGNLLTAECEVTVSTTLSVKLDKDKADAYTGTKFKLVATVVKNGVTTTSETQGVVTWKSSDTSIATVDAKTGEITPIKEGTVTISATTVDKDTNGYQLTVSCTLTVKKGELSIKMEKDKAELAVGANLTLVATVVKNGTTATSAVETWVTWKSSDPSIATVNERTGEVTGVKAGTVTITATTVDKDINGNQLSATCTVTVGGGPATDTTTKLKDTNGNQVFIKDASGNYVEAALADYYSAQKFYIRSATQYKYTGWQTIDNATYYFDKNGNYVTGKQVIQGVEYTFANNGVLSMGNGVFGIDVSKWNGNIDWNAVKNSGVSYVIIRCGFRGSTQGALIEDAMFRKNIEGAQAAGIQVGVYFYTQAINEVEAVEEASMVLALVQKYRISYPIFIDTEASGGRADRISKETRTAVCRAFCETIRNAGYTPGIYASKSWFTDKLNISSLSSYKIWLAQYATKPTYTGRYDVWQYSDKGTINGISGKVDVNYSYLGY